MEETQVNDVNTVVDKTEEPKAEEIKTEEEPKAEKTFTQEQVNAFVQNRLSAIYGGYGVKDKAELDELVQKSRDYDELKTRYDSLEKDHYSKSEQLTFIENDINPERYDDIRVYFKGKELVFNAENLIKELETHPEWIKPKVEKPVTTITVGKSKQEKPTEDEKQKAFKLFGV